MPTFDLGKFKLTPKGAYDSSTAYEALDVVTYNYSSYLVLQNVQGITPTGDNVNYQLIASGVDPAELDSLEQDISELDSSKQDKITGKGLSTEDYTTAEKTKLYGIETGANKTVVDSVLSSKSTNPVQNNVVKEALDGKSDKQQIITTNWFNRFNKDTVTINTSNNRWTSAHIDISDVQVGTKIIVLYGDAQQPIIVVSLKIYDENDTVLSTATMTNTGIDQVSGGKYLIAVSNVVASQSLDKFTITTEGAENMYEKYRTPAKFTELPLKIQTFNVGCYNGGNSTPHPNDSDLQADLIAWRRMYGEQSPDILFTQEENRYFDVDSTIATYEDIYSQWFPSYVRGRRNGYYSNGIYSKYPISNCVTKAFTAKYQNASQFYTKCEIDINGVTVLAISAQLTPLDTATRALQLAELKTMTDDYDNYIIGGDTNIVTISEITDVFTNSNLANGQFFGEFASSQNTGYARDNIITNFDFTNVKMLDSFTKSDHYSIVANAVLKLESEAT